MNRAQPTEFRSIKWEGRQADGLLCSFVVRLCRCPQPLERNRWTGKWRKKNSVLNLRWLKKKLPLVARADSSICLLMMCNQYSFARAVIAVTLPKDLDQSAELGFKLWWKAARSAVVSTFSHFTLVLLYCIVSVRVNICPTTTGLMGDEWIEGWFLTSIK